MSSLITLTLNSPKGISQYSLFHIACSTCSSFYYKRSVFFYVLPNSSFTKLPGESKTGCQSLNLLISSRVISSRASLSSSYLFIQTLFSSPVAAPSLAALCVPSCVNTNLVPPILTYVFPCLWKPTWCHQYNQAHYTIIGAPQHHTYSLLYIQAHYTVFCTPQHQKDFSVPYCHATSHHFTTTPCLQYTPSPLTQFNTLNHPKTRLKYTIAPHTRSSIHPSILNRVQYTLESGFSALKHPTHTVQWTFEP